MSKQDILVLHTTDAESGRTLVSALRKWLPDQSWNQLRRWVESRRIQIDGNLCVDGGRKLKTGEVVRVLPQSQQAPPSPSDIRIVFWDSHVVVVEKPAGMTSTRHSEESGWPQRRRDKLPTLDEAIPRLLNRKRDGKGQRMPTVRAVHRLDRDTSGLLVFARTAAAERHLVRQFRSHTVHRRYLAIVHGLVAAQTISARIVRDRGDGRRGTTSDPKQGQHAVTHVRPLETLGDYSLIECRLETGRTHQIRIHLAELGHLVCGDKAYCQRLHQKPWVDNSGAPRLALHAAELGFEHPATGEQHRFKMPFPPDLQQFLARLRQGRKRPRA